MASPIVEGSGVVVQETAAANGSDRAATATSGGPNVGAAADHPWLDVPARRIAAGPHDLFLMDTGGDGPPVLLVHGLGSTASFWQRQLTGELASGFRLIAVDLPGWGRSSQPDAAYTPSFYAGALVATLDALGLERAHVIGHSMGGQAAIALALAHPERVDRLVLSAPAGIETFTPQEAALIAGASTEEAFRGRSDEALAAAFAMAFGTWDEDVDRLLDERRAVAGERLERQIRATARSVQGMLAEPVFDRLGRVAAPTLMVFGTADALIPSPLHPTETPASIAERGAAAIPGARLSMIEGAGHTPHHDAPAAFDAVVASFLAGPQPPRNP